MSQPLTPYIRFELALQRAYSVPAGEQFRVVDAEQHPDLAAADDLWPSLDDRRVRKRVTLTNHPLDQRPPSMRRPLAARLKRLRLDAGLTTTELARATGISQGKISKIETAAQSVRVDHVDVWARACHADAETRDQLLELAHAALTEASAWRREQRAGIAAKQRGVAGWEQRAARIRDFQTALIPGLLQTRSYANAVLAVGDTSEQRDLAAGVSARIARQRILTQPTPQLELIVAEAALVWLLPGGDQVWPEQRQRLIDAATDQRLRLGVLPSAASGPPRLNAFTIYDFADTGEQLVVVETFAAELYHEDHRDVAVHVEIFEALSAAAWFGEAAAELVRAGG